MEGNNTLNLFVDTQHVRLLTITLGGVNPAQITLPAADIILNSICDPDTNTKALMHAIEVLKASTIPVINPPQNIFRTTRDMSYKHLKGIKGVLMPKNIRITPRRISEVPLLLEKEGLEYPYIFRSAGEHGGSGMALVKDEKDLSLLEQFAFDGRDFYAIEFVDFCSDDGLYRKYRIVIIDGKVYPRHLIISKSWNIHSETRAELMDSDKKYKEEELEYLRHPHPALEQQCLEIYEAMGLDFLGIDCHINEKGEMLIFEVNTCMRIIVDNPIDYTRPFIDHIRSAFMEMLESRIST